MDISEVPDEEFKVYKDTQQGQKNNAWWTL